MNRLSFLLLPALVLGCGDDGPSRMRPDTGTSPIFDGGFRCLDSLSEACLNDVHFSCESDGEFLTPVMEDCTAMGLVCVPDLWCVVCQPGAITCMENASYECREDGSGWDLIEECDIDVGEACQDGQCQNLCELAVTNRSYVGCEFYAADLDNASIAVGRDASAQQYAVVVSNPSQAVSTEVTVEINNAPFGMAPDIEQIQTLTVLPDDLEVILLPRREIDGSSSNALCDPIRRSCDGSEVCLCSSMDTEPPCFCRNTAMSSGMNDGTHTAVTSRAFRIRSQLPIVAYQFNPLDNVGVFSNDASLLLPTSALGDEYTVVSWPQTIADDPLTMAGGSPSPDPDTDFDVTRDDEGLRGSLTILGTQQATSLTINLGLEVFQVIGAGPIPPSGPGDSLELTIGPFDVVNLETTGLNADFTGTFIQADKPVAVFAGSEASDVPRFETYSTRQCCADHLEEQLFPDNSLGRRFLIGRMPRRSVALNNAFVDPTRDSVGEPNEPEWVRVIAVASGMTMITTTLPEPDDAIVLRQREEIILKATQDFIMEADQPVSVLQALPSQEAVGIPSEYPGGDPAIIAVPPAEQYRSQYVFLTPDLYAFDFVTITAEADTQILLDGEPLDPIRCTVSAADGRERRPGDPPPREVVHRCQLSYPDVIGLPNVRVLDGDQNDGVHTIIADKPVGIIVYGFDAFVSYAYAGGLDLDIIN